MSLLQYLFSEMNQTNEKPQVYLAKNKKKVLICLPSANRDLKKEEINNYLSMEKLHKGYTGVAYESYEKPYENQNGKLYWFGIDIDTKTDASAYIPKIIKDLGHIATIRTSTSGKGLHLIIKLKKPVNYVNNSIYSTIKDKIKDIIEKLNNIGISSDKKEDTHICKIGGNFFLFGGKQRTLSVANKCLDLVLSDSSQFYNKQKSDDKVLELCRIRKEVTPFFVELINENIIKIIGNKKSKIKKDYFVAENNVDVLTPCNIGKVFDIICKLNLIACMYPENIDSDMLNDDINGFLNIEYGLINLYEFNSEKIIFSMELFNQQSQVDELNSMVKKIKKIKK